MGSRVERIRRLERWAETAMHELMRKRCDCYGTEAQARVAKSAWSMAVAMEDQRTATIKALRDLEPEEA